MSTQEEVPPLGRGAQVRGFVCVLLCYGLTLIALALWGFVYRTAVHNAVDLRPFLAVTAVLGVLHLLSLLGPLRRRVAGRGLRTRWNHAGGPVLVLIVGSIGGLVVTWLLLSTWDPPIL